MARKRNWYTYEYTVRGKVKHGGITQKLEDRKKKHEQKWPGGQMKKVGRAKTEDGARRWEKKKGYT